MTDIQKDNSPTPETPRKGELGHLAGAQPSIETQEAPKSLSERVLAFMGEHHEAVEVGTQAVLMLGAAVTHKNFGSKGVGELGNVFRSAEEATAGTEAKLLQGIGDEAGIRKPGSRLSDGTIPKEGEALTPRLQQELSGAPQPPGLASTIPVELNTGAKPSLSTRIADLNKADSVRIGESPFGLRVRRSPTPESPNVHVEAQPVQPAIHSEAALPKDKITADSPTAPVAEAKPATADAKAIDAPVVEAKPATAQAKAIDAPVVEAKPATAQAKAIDAPVVEAKPATAQAKAIDAPVVEAKPATAQAKAIDAPVVEAKPATAQAKAIDAPVVEAKPATAQAKAIDAPVVEAKPATAQAKAIDAPVVEAKPATAQAKAIDAPVVEAKPATAQAKAIDAPVVEAKPATAQAKAIDAPVVEAKPATAQAKAIDAPVVEAKPATAQAKAIDAPVVEAKPATAQAKAIDAPVVEAKPATAQAKAIDAPVVEAKPATAQAKAIDAPVVEAKPATAQAKAIDAPVVEAKPATAQAKAIDAPVVEAKPATAQAKAIDAPVVEAKPATAQAKAIDAPVVEAKPATAQAKAAQTHADGSVPETAQTAKPGVVGNGVKDVPPQLHPANEAPSQAPAAGAPGVTRNETIGPGGAHVDANGPAPLQAETPSLQGQPPREFAPDAQSAVGETAPNAVKRTHESGSIDTPLQKPSVPTQQHVSGSNVLHEPTPAVDPRTGVKLANEPVVAQKRVQPSQSGEIAPNEVVEPNGYDHELSRPTHAQNAPATHVQAPEIKATERAPNAAGTVRETLPAAERPSPSLQPANVLPEGGAAKPLEHAPSADAKFHGGERAEAAPQPAARVPDAVPGHTEPKLGVEAQPAARVPGHTEPKLGVETQPPARVPDAVPGHTEPKLGVEAQPPARVPDAVPGHTEPKLGVEAQPPARVPDAVPGHTEPNLSGEPQPKVKGAAELPAPVEAQARPHQGPTVEPTVQEPRIASEAPHAEPAPIRQPEARTPEPMPAREPLRAANDNQAPATGVQADNVVPFRRPETAAVETNVPGGAAANSGNAATQPTTTVDTRDLQKAAAVAAGVIGVPTLAAAEPNSTEAKSAVDPRLAAEPKLGADPKLADPKLAEGKTPADLANERQRSAAPIDDHIQAAQAHDAVVTKQFNDFVQAIAGMSQQQSAQVALEIRSLAQSLLPNIPAVSELNRIAASVEARADGVMTLTKSAFNALDDRMRSLLASQLSELQNAASDARFRAAVTESVARSLNPTPGFIAGSNSLLSQMAPTVPNTQFGTSTPGQVASAAEFAQGVIRATTSSEQLGISGMQLKAAETGEAPLSRIAQVNPDLAGTNSIEPASNQASFNPTLQSLVSYTQWSQGDLSKSSYYGATDDWNRFAPRFAPPPVVAEAVPAVQQFVPGPRIRTSSNDTSIIDPERRPRNQTPAYRIFDGERLRQLSQAALTGASRASTAAGIGGGKLSTTVAGLGMAMPAAHQTLLADAHKRFPTLEKTTEQGVDAQGGVSLAPATMASGINYNSATDPQAPLNLQAKTDDQELPAASV